MQDDSHPQPPTSHRLRKIVLLAIGGLLAVALIALGTAYALSQFIPSEQTTSQTTKSAKELAAEQAKQSLSDAVASEAQGKTDEAIAQYKEALARYQAAGDKAGEESVKLQIQYLESLQE